MPARAGQDPDTPGLGSVAPADHPPLPFPDADWEWFASRCQALGVPDAAARREVLSRLYGHLVGVNRWLNLTTVTSPRDWLKQHALDSLSCLGEPRLKHLSEGEPCLDLGSGGGYPGLPLALWLPRIAWVLADARRKKAEFLAAAATLTGNPRCTGRHLRGGEVKRSAPELHRACQLVVSRAMGQCDDVLAEAAPLLKRGGHCLVMKGPAFAGEERERTLKACPKLGYRFVAEHRLRLEDADPERVIATFQWVGDQSRR